MRVSSGLLLGLLSAPFSVAWSASSAIHRRQQKISVVKRGIKKIPSQRKTKISSAKTSLRMTSTKKESNEQKTEDALHRQHRISVAAVLASAFLNLLGFTMAGPITPALGQHFGLKVGASFGSLTSAYPLGMLLGLFLWPQLSDSVGRKPVMALSLLGSGLGLAFQARVISLEQSLAMFLATRVLTGSFAGSSPVSKAFLADVGSAEGKLPQYLAWRDAASTMAFIVGPLLGGVMFDARKRFLGLSEAADTTGSLAFVIGLSAAASLAASALVGFFVKEDASLAKAKKHVKDKPDSWSDDELIMCPLGSRIWTGVLTVCVVSFLYNVGDSTFHAFFSALLRDRLGLDAKSIGFSYTLFACMSFSVSATSASGILKKFGPVRTCVMGLSAIGSGLLMLAAATAAYATPPKALVLGAAGLYYCGVPLYGPTIPTMLLRCVPPNKRGAVMGLDGAINTVGRVIAPLAMGDLYRRYGPSAAFGLSGVLVFLAACTAALRRLAVVREMKTRYLKHCS